MVSTRSGGGGAIAKRAAAAAEAKRARLEREGKADVALIGRRLTRIREDFYDVGEALVRLKRPGVAQAMGHATFHALCEAELGLKRDRVDKLVDFVTRVKRELAVELDRERAGGLLAIADATPADDLEAVLAQRTIALPGGARIDLRATPTPELYETAKRVRLAVRGDRKVLGRTTTPAERAAAAELQSVLRATGEANATVEALATRPGAPCTFRIAKVGQSLVERLVTLFGATKGRRRGRKAPSKKRER